MNVTCVNCQKEIDVLKDTFVCVNCAYLNPLNDIDFFSYLQLPKSLEINKENLEIKFIELMGKYHPDNFVGASELEKINSLTHSGYLNKAYDSLKNETSRFAYMYELTNGQSIISENEVNSSELFMEFFEYYEELENIQHTYNLKIFRNKLLQLKQKILQENINIDFSYKDLAHSVYVKLKYIDKIISKALDRI
jgi:molecular chaperone HscB